MRSASRQILVMTLLSSLAVSHAMAQEPARVEIGSNEIRAVVEQYQAVLSGHADIICVYNFTSGEAANLEDAIARRWVAGSSEYASEGVYKSKGGKVLASEYSLEPAVDLGNNTQRGGVTRFLTNAEWRTLHTPDFHLMSVGHRGTFKNDRWGPSFTPWSLGVMGSTMHLPGTENLGVYNHIIDNLDSSAVTAHPATIQIPGQPSEAASICVSVSSGKGTGTRNYYFTTPKPFDVPLLAKFELYEKESKTPHTIAYVLEYGPGPTGLPFPMKCLRISYPLRGVGSFSSLWTKVTELEKSDRLTDADFVLEVRNGERAVLEDSGIGVRIPEDSKLDFEAMQRIEKQILEKIEKQSQVQEVNASVVQSHRTRYSFLLWANIILFVTIGTSLWWSHRKQKTEAT